MATQAIRRADGKGRHTTTYRALVPMPGGGAVLDTPGVRAVGLLDGADGLDRAFADIAELAARLPVRRLRSRRASRAARCGRRWTTGELPPRRWESWRKLQRELAYESRRREVRVRRRSGAGWRRPDARAARRDAG